MRILTALAMILAAGCTGDLTDLGPGGKGNGGGSSGSNGGSSGGGGSGGSAGSPGGNGGSGGSSGVTFAAIQADFDGHACDNSGCHGKGGSGAAVFPIVAMAAAQADIDANYAAVQNEINTTAGNQQNSLILTKNLVGGVTHAGGNTLFPNTSDALYLKWLNWIKAGAPKQ
jgi:hypothetical protein